MSYFIWLVLDFEAFKCCSGSNYLTASWIWRSALVLNDFSLICIISCLALAGWSSLRDTEQHRILHHVQWPTWQEDNTHLFSLHRQTRWANIRSEQICSAQKHIPSYIQLLWTVGIKKPPEGAPSRGGYEDKRRTLMINSLIKETPVIYLWFL